MIKTFQKLLKRFSGQGRADSRTGLRSRSGQVAIIIMLMAVFALIFYAVALNLGRVSQNKVYTTRAANSGATTLASFMASYGQQLFMETLGGKEEVCGWTGVFMAIVTLVITIIIVAIAIYTGQVQLLALSGALAMAAIALAAINLVLQVAVIQPAIDKMWNEIASQTMDTSGQFVEQGLRVGLQSMVTDNEWVPDLEDADQDTLFGEGVDEISRFAYYYTLLLREITPMDMTPVEEFLAATEELLYAGDDNWGMYDPWDPEHPHGSGGPNHECVYNPNNLEQRSPPSQCNPCCVPEEIVPFDDVEAPVGIGLRPGCCDSGGANECGQIGTCGLRSPHGVEYPWVYNRFYENRFNNCEDGVWPDCYISFLERLGVDDEHPGFFKNWENPNDIVQTEHTPGAETADFLRLSTEGFQVSDATGHYQPPLNVRGEPDMRYGVYPFFWKVSYWGVNLNGLAPPNPEVYHCYTCDPVFSPDNCEFCPDFNNPDLDAPPPELPVPARRPLPRTSPPDPAYTNLSLPRSPAEVVYNTTNRLDGSRNNRGGVLLGIDRVTPPRVQGGKGECLNSPLSMGGSRIWKPGADRYCSTEWPYEANCPKHGECSTPGFEGSADCACGEGGTNPELFNEDPLDRIVYSLADFIGNAEATVEAGTAGFEASYQYLADFIETPGLCYECNFNDPQQGGDLPTGYLYVLRDELVAISEVIGFWRYEQAFHSDGTGRYPICQEIWCTAPPGACTGGAAPPNLRVSPSENSTFGGGHIENVVTCLTYNVDGYDFENERVKMRGTNEGNPWRFQQCLNACDGDGGISPNPATSPDDQLYQLIVQTEEFCSADNTPRSLNPAFDPDLFDVEAPDAAMLTELFNCPIVCSECQNACAETCEVALEDCDISACLDGCQGMCGAGCECSEILEYNTACFDTQLALFKGACEAAHPFYQSVVESIPEAENQAAKFRLRRDFLYGLMLQAEYIVEETLLPAIERLDVYLNEIVPPYIEFRKNYEDLRNESRELTNSVIYGWRTAPPENDPDRTEGYWHIVKVDARMPGECDKACGTDQGVRGEHHKWPRVKSKKSGFLGSKRCYYLDNTDGSVKYRASRYDENLDEGNLNLPGGQPIWNFKYEHPERATIPASTVDLDSVCQVPNAIPEASGAFIMTKRDGFGGAMTACWDRATALLAKGATSESCMNYYFKKGMREGFSMNFTECRPF